MSTLQTTLAHCRHSVPSRSRWALSLLLLMGAQPAWPQPLATWVGPFDADLRAWQEVRLSKDLTPNQFTYRQWDGVQALEVQSKASMSLMARPLTIDLQATPVLCWRWRVDATLPTADMTRRQGDDYAARVYVSFKLPEDSIGFGLRTQLALARTLWGADLPDAAINYVWDNRHPIGTERPNAYTDRAMMIVQRSGDGQAKRWVQERRNVLDDVSRLFNRQARAVQLAVTADTDNTALEARAGFAEFHFVPMETPCQFTS
jgi:hypothetical protein